MVASCALFGKGLVTGKISAGLFRVEDLALVAFIFVGILSLLLGGEGLLTKNIQYTGRYVGVIGFYLFVIAILASRASRDTLLKWLVISVAVASAFGVVEFILKNIWQFPIDRYIYRPLVAESWTIYSGGLVRARSFAEEPGFFALFLTTLAPVALFWLLGRARKRYFVLLLVLTTTALVNLQRSRCRGCNRGRLCGLFRLPGEEQGEGSGYGPTYLKPCILFAGGLAYLGMVRRLPCADN